VKGDIEALVLRILAKFGMFVLPEKGKPSPYDRSRNMPGEGYRPKSLTEEAMLATGAAWRAYCEKAVREYDHLKRIEAAAREAVKSNGAAFWIAMHHLTEVLEAK